jgi:hypothetical protein
MPIMTKSQMVSQLCTRTVITTCSVRHIKHFLTLCGQNTEFLRMFKEAQVFTVGFYMLIGM